MMTFLTLQQYYNEILIFQQYSIYIEISEDYFRNIPSILRCYVGSEIIKPLRSKSRMQSLEIIMNRKKSHKIESVKISVVDLESSQRGFKIALKSYENYSNHMKFTEIT